MFKYIMIFFLMLIILLFPIPIKITLKYVNKVLEIFIYNKKINIKNFFNEDKKNKLNYESDTKSIKNFFKSLILNNIKLIIRQTKNSKFIPTLTLNTKIEYGLDDAALVAILFGLINSTYSLLYTILLNFAKVKDTDFKVIPHFEKSDLYIEISSIIYINFAKIIYMAFRMMLPCLINRKHNKSNMKKYKGGNVHG